MIPDLKFENLEMNQSNECNDDSFDEAIKKFFLLINAIHEAVKPAINRTKSILRNNPATSIKMLHIIAPIMHRYPYQVIFAHILLFSS